MTDENTENKKHTTQEQINAIAEKVLELEENIKALGDAINLVNKKLEYHQHNRQGEVVYPVAALE